ncbi:MAG: hypothetical protein FWJ62_00220 [Thermaerobacter sp.]
MNPRRLRRLERVARARRRLAEAELAEARRRLSAAQDAEAAALAGLDQAAARRQQALVAGVDAAEAAGLHRLVDAWRREADAAAVQRRQAEDSFQLAHSALTGAYRDQRSMELLAAGAERREAGERARRQWAEADDQFLVRFAFLREGR